MRSIADRLRARDRASSAESSAGERIEESLRLGRRDLELFAAANGLDERTAAERLDRAGRSGRRRCSLFASEPVR